jgi:hypothetical protein
MTKNRKQTRQMPKIYGNLEKPRRSFGGLFHWLRNVVSIGVLLGALYIVFVSSWFQVSKVEVQGTVFTSASEIEAMVPQGGNIWLFPREQVKQRVSIDSRIESVAVLRGLPHKVKVVVKERQPIVLWTTGSTVAVVGEDGRVFQKYELATLPGADTPLGATLAVLPNVVDSRALPAQVGQQVVSPVFTSFVASAKNELATNLPDLQIDHMEIADTTFDVTFIFKQGMRVYMSTLADPGVQSRNLARLIQQNKVNPASSQVDLRIDRWAYVK